jgi:MFS family permease
MSRLDYAFIGGLSISMAMFVSPICTTVTRRFGTHVTLLIGIFLETVSFISASFVQKSHPYQLFLSQGVAYGVAMGFIFVGSVGVVPQWFTSRRSLANSIAAAGSGLGGLSYSLGANAMIERYGIQWAFRVIGICTFVINVICWALIRDRNKAIGSSQLAFDYKLFKRPEYLLLQAFGVFSMLGYVVLLFSLPNYAQSVGLTAHQGSVIGAILNLGQMLGRPSIGFFSDAMGRINMAGAMTLIASLTAFCIWTFAKSYGVLLFYALI